MLLLVFVLVALICYVDYITGPEYRFGVFYLIPIAIASWYLGRWLGIVASVASLISWLVVALHDALDFRLVLAYTNAAALAAFYFVTTFSLSGLRRALERERELSLVDFLTGVANKRAFQTLAEMEKNRARRYHHPLTLAYLDIDNFKDVNDTWGHAAGDELLQRVGRSLRDSLRDTDHVARIGGDEFAILLPETDREAGQIVLGKLHRALQAVGSSYNRPVTFSIGVVTFVSGPDSLEQMVAAADRLMYAAKNSGKNQIAYEVVEAQHS
jgi:diguanylate cyclase (GGDEF)-like protein